MMTTTLKVDGVRIRRACSGCGAAPITEFSTQCRIVGVDDTGADILEEVYRDRCDECVAEGRKPNAVFSPLGPTMRRKAHELLKKRKKASAAIAKVRAKEGHVKQQ